jgi:hypothetical protein
MIIPCPVVPGSHVENKTEASELRVEVVHAIANEGDEDRHQAADEIGQLLSV